MKKLWSISTTVRNPERLRSFLGVLKKLEGQNFDDANQIRFQVLLIKERLYKPTNLKPEHQAVIEGAAEIPEETAREIFNHARYQDPPMRGRQSVNPLNKLGLCIAKGSAGPIVITELGNRLITEGAALPEVIFRSLLKLQFPNPASDEFSAADGFGISPLIASLHFINRVNALSDRKGLTREEFSYFVPSLINADDIDVQVEKLLAYRSASNKVVFKESFAKDFYGVENLTDKQKNNFREYGDNIMRYFRPTRYFLVRSGGLHGDWRIDLEPTRLKEIEMLLSVFDGKPRRFTDSDEYLNFLSDYNEPHLPWEDVDRLKEVVLSLRGVVLESAGRVGAAETLRGRSEFSADLDQLNVSQLTGVAASLRELNKEMQVKEKSGGLHRNTARLTALVATLNDRRAVNGLEPFEFEELLTDIFRGIDDEEIIKPNFLTDDEGNAISHAPGNRADIELYYSRFRATCEVTLDSGRSQWFREGQPVMRHLRAFEAANVGHDNYCLFVAPKIHVDTYSTFWTSVRHEYDGNAQKIIPLTTEQTAGIVEACIRLIAEDSFNHGVLHELFSKIISDSIECRGFSDWASRISTTIDIWKQRALSL